MAAPPVLFLDEPTTGLDPRSRIELWNLLGELVRDGATLLLTTQYLEEADRLADDIVVLDGGRIAAQGSPAELKARIGGERLEVTVGGAGELAAAAAALGHFASDGPPSTPTAAPRRRAGGHRRRAGRGRARARRRRRRHHRPAPPRGDARRRLPRHHRFHADDRGGRRLMSAHAERLRFGLSDSLVLARRNLVPHPPDPREAHRRHRPAADVRDPLRLRLRRGDRDPRRRRLPRVPDGRDLHPDADLRRHGPGDVDGDRPRRGHPRPLPLAADGALGLPDRPRARRVRRRAARPRP